MLPSLVNKDVYTVYIKTAVSWRNYLGHCVKFFMQYFYHFPRELYKKCYKIVLISLKLGRDRNLHMDWLILKKCDH